MITPFDNFLGFILNQSPVSGFWLIIKIMFLFALGIYLAFAVIIVRQVGLMSHSIEGGNLNFAVKIIGLVHLLASILVFFLALIIL